MKRIDFPIRPYLLKYLQVHLKLARIGEDPLQLEDYVLSKANRFGLALDLLLRKPVKSARHEGSIDDCTATLGVNLRNFNAAYFDLTRGKLTPYAIFQFNDTVDDHFNAELYWWVGKHVDRRATIKDAIRSFMVFYDIMEDDRSYESLRKLVQRNAELVPKKKKKAKPENFSMNSSQKIGEVSRKKGVVSQKIGVMSHKDMFRSVREQLMRLPIALFETEFYHARS
ncbi:hypothetical protein [Hymenobacter convexus]|uniref:hypothetical protein n=1 Tax=Hymenobacter sp. CA1UV-4 TaxID=3063782 RepID=UPI0027131AA2|nr:hypothetical protein [Hymenobacter sp. CA1UV-4]MDO7853170.1 hypothetical protein [Hymenobacter sp. CA1UV-4]